MSNNETKSENQIIEHIAKKYLRVEDLKTKNSDRLDFYEVAVWDIKEALTQAFMKGTELGLKLNNPDYLTDTDKNTNHSTCAIQADNQLTAIAELKSKATEKIIDFIKKNECYKSIPVESTTFKEDLFSWNSPVGSIYYFKENGFANIKNIYLKDVSKKSVIDTLYLHIMTINKDLVDDYVNLDIVELLNNSEYTTGFEYKPLNEDHEEEISNIQRYINKKITKDVEFLNELSNVTFPMQTTKLKFGFDFDSCIIKLTENDIKPRGGAENKNTLLGFKKIEKDFIQQQITLMSEKNEEIIRIRQALLPVINRLHEHSQQDSFKP